jgi:RecA/RadA recombinase
MPGRFEVLNAFVGKVRKDLGDVLGPYQSFRRDLRRIRTQSLSLDYVSGGGIPAGRITMLRGEKGSGKTTTALRIAAEAQKLCRNCLRPVADLTVTRKGKDERPIVTGMCDCVKNGIFRVPQLEGEVDKDYKARLEEMTNNSYEELIVTWFDIEGVFDPVWAGRVGLDVSRVVFGRAETAESTIDIYDGLLRTGTVDFTVVDSVAMLTPSKEIEASMEEWQQGLQARLINKWVRKTSSAMSACAVEFNRVPTQIWVQQFRAKIGTIPGKVVPGGMGQEFATSVELDFWTAKSEVKTEKVDVGKKGEEVTIPLAQTIHVYCSKNKVAPPFKEGLYTQILTDSEGMLGQIDDVPVIMRWSKKFEVLTQEKKGGPYMARVSPGEPLPYRTQEECENALRASPGLRKQFCDRLLQILLEEHK